MSSFIQENEIQQIFSIMILVYLYFLMSIPRGLMPIIPTKIGLTQSAFSKQPFNLLMYTLKRVWGRGKPFLSPILLLISFNQCLVFLNLAIPFSYKLITIAPKLKGTFSSSNLFQRLAPGVVSKYFIQSMKQHKRLFLLMFHSSIMILSVTMSSTIEL
jgi:hypothetical protein